VLYSVRELKEGGGGSGADAYMPHRGEPKNREEKAMIDARVAEIRELAFQQQANAASIASEPSPPPSSSPPLAPSPQPGGGPPSRSASVNDRPMPSARASPSDQPLPSSRGSAIAQPPLTGRVRISSFPFFFLQLN
jgi:hypothetical protein